MLTKNMIAALTIVSTITIVGSQANADRYRRIELNASAVEDHACELMSELRHFRHTPAYRHLRADARQFEVRAIRVRRIAHNHGCLVTLQREVNEMDALFHHIERLMADIERRSDCGRGHIHGDTRHVWRLVRHIESDIHQMQRDIAVLRRNANRHRDHYRPRYEPVPPPRYHRVPPPRYHRVPQPRYDRVPSCQSRRNSYHHTYKHPHNVPRHGKNYHRTSGGSFGVHGRNGGLVIRF